MTNVLKWFFPILGLLLLIWVNLPTAVPLNFSIGGISIDTEISRPTIRIPFDDGDFVRDFGLKLGLDLQGGTRLVFEAKTDDLADADVGPALASARDIVERRVNLFGIAEPSVRTIQSGDIHRIAVDLPGVNNAAEAVSLIGSTAQLSFREVATDTASLDTQDDMATISAQQELFVDKADLTGELVDRASVVFSQETGEVLVQLEFTGEGAEKFADITQRSVGQPVAIYLDNNVISAPVVQQPILDGVAVISGQFTTDEAEELAISINSGALPVPLELAEQTSVGPTLGEREVAMSLFAGTVGLLMVMLFMILYYGRLGWIACMALIIYGLISLAIFRFIPIVLTLPGIAGFILSIGMAVDANILIFERIREEQRKGREFATAIRLGFGRAMDAIKDANITTILVAFILFNPLNWQFLPQFGLVRGFALTLAIGVIVSLFTGVFITRHLIRVFYRQSRS